MRMVTLTETVQFVTETCCNCGVLFALTQEHYQELRRDWDRWFYCPNGHRQHYTDTTEMRLRREVEREQAAKKRLLVELELSRAAHESTKHSLRATRAAKTRVLKRIQNGVCPVCNRHFCDLERHMKGQHPKADKG